MVLFLGGLFRLIIVCFFVMYILPYAIAFLTLTQGALTSFCSHFTNHGNILHYINFLEYKAPFVSCDIWKIFFWNILESPKKSSDRAR